MIMSEKLYQNPIPEWNAAWFIRGENPMYTHVKKLSELSFSPVYNETTVTNGYMDHTYIEKNFLIDLLSLNSASTEQVYIFSGFLQSELLRLLRVPCPPPLFCNPVTVYRSSLNSETPVFESDQKLVPMFTWKQVKKCS